MRLRNEERYISVLSERLIWILIVASICRNDAHKEVRGIAKEAVVELERKKVEYDAKLST